MTRLIHSLALVAAVSLVPAIAAAQPAFHTDYQVVGSREEQRDGLVRTVDTVQAGPAAIDRFDVVHVRHPGLAPGRGAILRAPPLGTGFQFYENADTLRYQDSIAGFLATRGFDVWGYSQRVQGLPAGTCESGADCTPMAGWGLAQLAADAEYVRGRIVTARPGERPVIGGMSLGGMIGVASIDAHPAAYRGAIVIDAGLYSRDPVSIGLATAGCQLMRGALGAGLAWDGQQVGFLKLVNTLAALAPGAPSPVMPGLTNAQAWVTVMTVPVPGPTTLTPGFIFDAGDPATGTLTYADADHLHRNFDTFVDYITFAELRDVDCSVAGERTFTANLGAFTGPVFSITAGRGFAGIVDDTIELMTSARLTRLVYPDYGHQDVVFSTSHRADLERPLLQWLETVAFAPAAD